MVLTLVLCYEVLPVMRCSNGEWVPSVVSEFLATYNIPFPSLRGGEQGRNECNPVPCVVSAGVQDRADAH